MKDNKIKILKMEKTQHSNQVKTKEIDDFAI